MTDHITADEWLQIGGEASGPHAHVATCAECQALTEDLDSIRASARALPEGGWAGDPALDLDLEGALAEVLAATAPRPWRRAPIVLRFASSLAAAVLLFSAAAPSFLQWRLEATPTTAHAPQAFAPTPSSIFWTTASNP